MFAIAGGKGGCGKTTTTLGLARALAAAGTDPLVVDADVDMPDVHIVAGLPATPNAADIADGAHLACASQTTSEFPGVAFVPAGRSGNTGPALDRLTGWDGPVLVDCPAGLSEDATLPLGKCEATVLVTTDTPQSLSDARKTAQVAARFGAPVAATLVRGPDASTVDAPVETGHVERVPDSDGGRVPTDTPFRSACRSIAEVALSFGGDIPRTDDYSGHIGRRRAVSSGDSRIGSDNAGGIFNGG